MSHFLEGHTAVVKHNNGSIGNTSSKGPFSIAMLDYRSVVSVFLFLDHHLTYLNEENTPPRHPGCVYFFFANVGTLTHLVATICSSFSMKNSHSWLAYFAHHNSHHPTNHHVSLLPADFTLKYNKNTMVSFF